MININFTATDLLEEEQNDFFQDIMDNSLCESVSEARSIAAKLHSLYLCNHLTNYHLSYLDVEEGQQFVFHSPSCRNDSMVETTIEDEAFFASHLSFSHDITTMQFNNINSVSIIVKITKASVDSFYNLDEDLEIKTDSFAFNIDLTTSQCEEVDKHSYYLFCENQALDVLHALSTYMKEELVSKLTNKPHFEIYLNELVSLSRGEVSIPYSISYLSDHQIGSITLPIDNLDNYRIDSLTESLSSSMSDIEREYMHSFLRFTINESSQQIEHLHFQQITQNKQTKSKALSRKI